jgi:hypothetical protein
MRVTYRGKLHGGVVVLEPGVQLPDGLDVIVQPVPAPPAAAIPPRIMRNGVPVFPRTSGTLTPGLEIVNQLRDETL